MTKMTSIFTGLVLAALVQNCHSTGDHEDVRLVDGPDAFQGRLQVQRHGVWGTVCKKQFTTRDGDVVCRQLFTTESGESVAVNVTQEFGPDVSGAPIHYSKVKCNGDEHYLDVCPMTSPPTQNCNDHDKDVGVICSNPAETGLHTIEDIRLMVDNTLGTNEGRVEIKVSGLWGTVCDDRWGYREANVACRHLGFDYGEPLTDAAHGEADVNVPIWIDNVDCQGSEDNLVDCGHHGYGVHNCDHSEDASVICYNVPDGCPTSLHKNVVDVVESDGRCYEMVDKNIHWKRARRDCYNRYGQLAVIRDAATDLKVRQMGQKLNGWYAGPANKYWIGLNDVSNEGQWYWVNHNNNDGHVVDGSSYTNWRYDVSPAPGPINGQKDCAHVWFKRNKEDEFDWRDARCNKVMPYVCEYDLNECATNPCLNGGDCQNKDNGFFCDCLFEYTGVLCETLIDGNECASNPCLNGGACQDKDNGFFCDCLFEYTGVLCETLIDGSGSLPW